MAIAVMKSGQAVTLKAEQGEQLWFIINQEITGSPEQRLFAKKVDRLYLNKHNAPESYKAVHNIELPVHRRLMEGKD